MPSTRQHLAELAAHVSAMNVAVQTIARHLQETQQALHALMAQQGVTPSGEGLTPPEQQGS